MNKNSPNYLRARSGNRGGRREEFRAPQEFASSSGDLVLCTAPRALIGFFAHVLAAFQPIGILLALCSSQALLAETHPEYAGDQSERLKKFIASPPEIQSLVFIKKLYPDADLPKSRWQDIDLRNSTNFLFLNASWKPNTFVIKTGPSVESVKGSGIDDFWLFHRAREYWLIKQGFHMLYWSNEDASQEPSRTADPANQILSAVGYFGDDLTRVMNLGINNAPIGTIRWEGDHFQGYFAERQQSISGQLFKRADGLADHLEIDYTSDGRGVKYRAEYGYSGPMPLGFLPTTIRIWQLKKNGEIERDWYSIVSVEATSHMSDGGFDPASVARLHHLKTIVYRRGHYFDKNDSQAQEEEVPIRALDLNDRTTQNRVAYFSVNSAVTGLFLVLALRTRKQINKENRIKEGKT